jgi:hypothetical protein
VHEIEAAHGGGKRAGEADGAGVVDEDINAAEGLDGLGHGLVNLLVGTNVHGAGQSFAAGRLEFSGGGVNSARELRVGLDGLGGDNDVGAVARGAEADGLADSATGAGDEEGFSV